MLSESQKNELILPVFNMPPIDKELTEENEFSFICWYFGEKTKTREEHAKEQIEKYKNFLDGLSKI